MKPDVISRIFSCRLWLIAGAVAFTCMVSSAQETPNEARVAARTALASGEFDKAIHPLTMLIDWLNTSKNLSTQIEVENARYHLGMCYFLTGNLAEAQTAFKTYLKLYHRGSQAPAAAAYLGDSYRFSSNMKEALNAYSYALKTYSYSPDWTTDILCSTAKCYLADERWNDAAPYLLEIYQTAPDFRRRNWAAALLSVSFLKKMDVNKVYDIMPYLLNPKSFAARSAALNMAAIEVGEALFADEKYLDALWIYRIIYPRSVLLKHAQIELEQLMLMADRYRKMPDRLRQLVRAQEDIGALEEEIKALNEIKDYDIELSYRVARSYMEIRRYWESMELFWHLYKEGLPEKTEECLYLAFISASSISPMNRALKMGAEYMEMYPEGEFYDTISLTTGQLYAKAQDWPNVIATLTEALKVSPHHENIVECMFLIGYASFMEEKFQDTVTWLTKMNTEYPDNDREADGTYWIGMALLFDKKYDKAVVYFDRITTDFPNSEYVEDSYFRSATCDFALSLFKKSEPKLLAFVDRYPNSKLTGEAYVMLGDVAGVFGQLEKAIQHYNKVLLHEVNIELYNHAVFRSGEMLDEMKKYDDVIRHFNAYLERNRQESNIPLATYWVGNAYWKKEEKEKALKFYLEAVEKYGKHRTAMGIDLILEEWVGKTKSVDQSLARKGWQDIRNLMKKADEQKQQTLVLHIKRVLLYDPSTKDSDKEQLMKSILNENNLPHASVIVLEMIADKAWETGDKNLALKAANKLVEDFPETDSGLAARMLIAQEAIDRKDYEEAIKHLTIIRETFAASNEAAKALLLLGQAYMEQRKYDKADEAYQSLLGVKAWKSLWPDALYGRGMVAFKQRKYTNAAVYYERIYVMYSAHRQWTAKAYLARAECLRQMHEYVKAIETLEEMISMQELDKFPETEEARKLLGELKKRV